MMNIENFSLLEAVELAIKMEEEGITFYNLAAEKTDGEEKKLFLFLKDNEYDHINTFRGFYSEISALEGTTDAELYMADPDVSAYLRAFVESTVFPVKGSARKVFDNTQNTADILKLGMRIEKDSILYYQELAQNTGYPEAKEILEKIIGEERRHFRALHKIWKKKIINK